MESNLSQMLTTRVPRYDPKWFMKQQNSIKIKKIKN